MDWQGAEKDDLNLVKLAIVFLGVYSWEVINTLPFDFSLLKDRRPNYHVLPYLICRYAALCFIISLASLVNLPSVPSCQSFYVFLYFIRNLSIFSATVTLILRTIDVWDKEFFVTISLTILATAQVAMLSYDISTIRSTRNERNTCNIGPTDDWVSAAASSIYTTSFSIVLLVVYAFRFINRPFISRPIRPMNILFNHGGIFFLVNIIANMIPSIFFIIKLRPIVNFMSTVPTCIASAIACCRLAAQSLHRGNDSILSLGRTPARTSLSHVRSTDKNDPLNMPTIIPRFPKRTFGFFDRDSGWFGSNRTQQSGHSPNTINVDFLGPTQGALGQLTYHHQREDDFDDLAFSNTHSLSYYDHKFVSPPSRRTRSNGKNDGPLSIVITDDENQYGHELEPPIGGGSIASSELLESQTEDDSKQVQGGIFDSPEKPTESLHDVQTYDGMPELERGESRNTNCEFSFARSPRGEKVDAAQGLGI